MGRSTGYCFKIIACGGSSESVDRDDLDAASENKATTDKKGWSFRKKSSGHRVLSNTVNVITETPSSDDKKSSEPVLINSEPPVSFPESEKTSANQCTEEFSRVSTSNTKDNIHNTVSNLVTKADEDEDDIKSDSSFDESSIIVIQTAIRSFLAQREVKRIKHVVKLQAVVRGHIVRCHAAGTLRCIQAIVKMQALVRARCSNASAKRLSLAKKGIQSSTTKPHSAYISIEKLLSNRFANQLMESTPRIKQINIKCDPSKQDSTWYWLQKWTSISSPETKPLTLTTAAPTPPETTATEAEPPKRPAKRAATDHPDSDSDGRKSVFGSKKASNPSFIAAQSKFEELTLTSTSKTTEPPAKATEPVAYESLKVGRTAGSECGTELSVTSMLDSPDPSESGNTEPKNTESTHSIEEHDLLGTELTHSISILPETYNTNEMTKSPLAPQSEPKPSPISEIKSERTPSSIKRVSNEKPKVWSSSKKLSPVLRGSLENLGNNRRNSFGSQSSEIEVEGRDSHSHSRSSGSSNCIPSYMQVTESARAKALNSSPRLSPDVQGKEAAYMKKRHSMPGAIGLNGRHGSPRVKSSSPQSQQTTKERKWQN